MAVMVRSAGVRESMATSPDCVRVVLAAARTISDFALDALREAVLLIDTRPAHLPVLLANAAARRLFVEAPDGASMQGSCLYEWLSAAEAESIGATLANLSRHQDGVSRIVSWRSAAGETPVMTDFKLIDGALGARVVMLTFAASAPKPELLFAIDKLPMDLLILDRNLKITYANAAAVRSAQLGAAKLLGCSALSVSPTAALSINVYRHALEGTAFHGEPVEFVRAGGAARWYELRVQPLMSGSCVVGLLIISTDVTERCLEARAQTCSERRLQALTEYAHDVIAVAGPDGEILYLSGGVTSALGSTPQERCWRNLFDPVHADDVAGLRAAYRRMVAGETGAFTREFRIQHRDGTYRWFESSCVPALDNPLIGGVVINCRDITARKQAELQLRQREEIFRLAADAVDGVIFEWDVPSGRVERSRGLLELLGLHPDALPGHVDAWRNRIHPPDLEATLEKIAAALESGRGWTTTYRIRDARNRYRLIFERALIQRNADGQPLRAIGCAVDVTEVNRLTDLLAETQRASKTGGWEYLHRTRELTWTDELYRIFETTPAEFEVTLESALSRLTPESRDRLDAAFGAAAARNGQFDLELEIITLKAQRTWVRLIGHFDRLAGRAIRVFGSLQNIQSQRLAQIALESRTDWLRLSINMAQLRAWRWDRRADLFEFAALKRRGAMPHRYPGIARILARMHPDDRPAVDRAIEHAFATGAESQGEFRLLAKDGSYRIYATTARPIHDAAHEPCGLVGVTQDITASRQSELSLRRSEELLRATTENAADTLILLDADLRIRFVNKALRGISIEQMDGLSVERMLPAAARERVSASLRHVLESGEAASFEFEDNGAGEAPRYFENRAVRVQGPSVGPGISLSVRDVTEYKRLEREIIEVSGRERQRIGRDLHDGLGQELTGIALMMRALARRLERQCPEALAATNEIVALVNQSIDSTRCLARGLLPVSTEQGGLLPALRGLADRSRGQYGLDVQFSAEIWPKLVLDEAKASHLYRIAQEALTNAARHAQASLVEIALNVTEDRFRLKIADNGCGMPNLGSAMNGLGMKIMAYRANIIGAKLECMRNPGGGSIVQVTGQQP